MREGFRSLLVRSEAPGGPRTLAVVRILTATVLLSSMLAPRFGGRRLDRLLTLTDLPVELRSYPRGWQWLGNAVDPFPDWALTAAWIALLAALVAVLVGWRGRLAAGVGAVLATYVFLPPYVFGKVDHAAMHLLWLLLVCALAPSCDDLAVRREQVARTPWDYAWPVVAIWMLLGAIYLFPGVGKIVSVGLDWAFSDNLANLMRQKWWGVDWQGMVVVDTGRFAPLLRLAALVALLVELSWIVFTWRRRGRIFLLIAGTAFHLGSWAFMGINFLPYLLPAYATLFPMDPPVEGETGWVPSGAAKATAVFVLGVFLVSATFIENRWPVSTYPMFSGVATNRAATIVVATDEGPVEPFEQVGRSIRRRLAAKSVADPAARDALLAEVGEPFSICLVQYTLTDRSAEIATIEDLDPGGPACDALAEDGQPG